MVALRTIAFTTSAFLFTVKVLGVTQHEIGWFTVCLPILVLFGFGVLCGILAQIK